MKKTKAGLIAPMASLSHPTEGWYSIKAASGGVCEMSIMGDIGSWGISAKQFATDLKAQAEGASLINLDLHSLGGDVMDGIAIYNLLKNHPARVHITITGIAASMGSVIAMAGDVVRIPANAWMMIHSPWGIQGGNASDMREYADLLDRFEGSLLLAYTEKTGKSEEEIKALLAEETWLMGAEVVEHGFADEVLDAVEAAASINSKRAKDFEKMPEAAKKMFTAPKGQTNTTPPEGNKPPAPSAPPAPNGGLNEEQIKAQALQEEAQRRTEVSAVFAKFEGYGDLMAECLNDMEITPAQAREKLLDAVGAQSGAQPAKGGYGAHINVGNGNIVGDHMANAIAARAGIEVLEKDNGMRGMTLHECARASLTERGVSTYGTDRLEMIGLAFTHSSSDFGNILKNVANKSMLKGAQEAQETFQLWTQKGTLSDFKITDRVGLESFPTLDKVADGAEYKSATLNDTGEQIQLATYGKLFSISRQTIINDDLQAFTRIPGFMGRAALRTIGDLVYAILMSNPKMKDGTALFHANHNNLMDAAELGVDSIEAMATKMALQKDSGGAALNIEPSYLITPRALKSRANALMNSIHDPYSDKPNSVNTVNGLYTPVSDARIDAAVKAGQPLPWFLAAGSMFDTIEVAYLDGNDQPFLEQQDGWKIDGAEFKVRHDAGVSAMSHRTLAKNPGVV